MHVCKRRHDIYKGNRANASSTPIITFCNKFKTKPYFLICRNAMRTRYSETKTFRPEILRKMRANAIG